MTMDRKSKWKLILVVYLVGWIIALIAITITFWPRKPGITRSEIKRLYSAELVEPNEPTLSIIFEGTNDFALGHMYEISRQSDSAIVFSPVRFYISDRDFMILVLTIGALGACLHGISSLALWVGQRRFSEDWGLWYLSRPAAGAILAVLFYLIIRGGFFPQVDADRSGFYGIIGLSGLFGLFSKQALSKLSDLFDVIFATEKDNDRLKDLVKGPPPNPAPEIESIEPTKVSVGQKDLSLTIKGKHFIPGCVAKIGEEEIKTHFVSDSEINVELREKDTAEAGTLSVAVQNPAPGGGLSGSKEITVEEPSD
jgi:hypothetical protein